MQRVAWLWIGRVMLLGAGCANGDSQEYGQCEAPDDHLKVMFKPKTPGVVFSHSFCVVCNTAIEPEEFGEWAQAMGATNIPEDPYLPCLYVCPGAPENVDSMSQSHSLVCDGEATYSDMVSGSNGNFDLTPVLDGSAFDLLSPTWSPMEPDSQHTRMAPMTRSSATRSTLP
jgi:hypothetical protein